MLEKVDLTKKLDKEEYKELVDNLRMRLGRLQRTARERGIPTLIVMEGWDAAGKGTLMNELLLSLDPRGVNVHVTQAPNSEEALRPFFWRFWGKLPAKGRMAIFDRSWYRRLLSERQEQVCSEAQVQAAFHDIPAFERQLTDEGYLVIKLFLHISKKEQGERLRKLADDPAAAWRVSERDWQHHKQYDAYLPLIEEMLRKTDTDFAPWTVIEAHNRRFATAKMLAVIAEALEQRLQQPDTVSRHEHDLVLAGRVDKRLDSSILTQVDVEQQVAETVYQKKIKEYQERMRELEHRIYQKRIPVVILFEGWDAAGKGGAIRRLTQQMDPRGYTVTPIAAPNDEERAHHYLWRFWRAFPKGGHIGIFDRSWYGRVLVERVEGFCRPEAWRRAYREINEMEEQWADYGTVLVKFWLHIDQAEQGRRFEERMATPEKQWKITEEDWRNREKWAQYEEAVDEMFLRTSTQQAPWTIVEANSKYFARLKVLERVIQAIEAVL